MPDTVETRKLDAQDVAAAQFFALAFKKAIAAENPELDRHDLKAYQVGYENGFCDLAKKTVPINMLMILAEALRPGNPANALDIETFILGLKHWR